jgi:glycosyltransferase involved in cell wall biosynthesis
VKKILLVGNTESIHFYRWFRFVRMAGYSCDILTFTPVRFDYTGADRLFDLSVPDGFRFKPLRKGLAWLKGLLTVLRGGYSRVNIHYFELHKALLALMSRDPVILTFWGSDYHQFFIRARGIVRKLLEAAVRKAAAATADTDTIAEPVSRLCRGGCRKIIWGVDTGLFKPLPEGERAVLKEKYGFKPSDRILLSIRNVTPFYRILDIIRQFKTLKGEDLRLWVRITPYSDREYVASCRDDAAGDRRIVFHDATLKPEDMAGLYQIASVCLHYPIEDALPVSLLEGIACGCRMLLSDRVQEYQNRAEEFLLTLSALEKLNDETIRQMLQMPEDTLLKNREIVIERYSHLESIRRIRELFLKG